MVEIELSLVIAFVCKYVWGVEQIGTQMNSVYKMIISNE